MTRIDYHLHTEYSPDCRTEVTAVADAALASGVDVLCITDHDTIEGAEILAAQAPAGLQVIVGCEFTTEDGTQVVGVGLTEMITEPRLLQLIDAIRDQGALSLLPHPFRRPGGIFRKEMKRSDEYVRDVLSRVDLVEAHNGRDNYEDNRLNLDLVKRYNLAGVASSDAHTVEEVGSVFVEYADPAVEHGVSARRLHFPDQEPDASKRLTRIGRDIYRQYKGRLPHFAQTAARASAVRAGVVSDQEPSRVPHPQYHLEQAESTHEA